MDLVGARCWPEDHVRSQNSETPTTNNRLYICFLLCRPLRSMNNSKLKRWVLMLMRRACGMAEELGLRKWGLKKLIASSCGSTRALKYIIETGKSI
ncbi:hypothetical protein LguiA_010464 [Lonicera macranthoides]